MTATSRLALVGSNSSLRYIPMTDDVDARWVAPAGLTADDLPQLARHWDGYDDGQYWMVFNAAVGQVVAHGPVCDTAYGSAGEFLADGWCLPGEVVAQVAPWAFEKIWPAVAAAPHPGTAFLPATPRPVRMSDWLHIASTTCWAAAVHLATAEVPAAEVPAVASGLDRIRAAATALGDTHLLTGRASWSLGSLAQVSDEASAMTVEYNLVAVEAGLRHWLTAPKVTPTAAAAAGELRAAYDAWAPATLPEQEWLTCETCGVTGPQVAEAADPADELLDPGEETEPITVCGRCLLGHEYDI